MLIEPNLVHKAVPGLEPAGCHNARCGGLPGLLFAREGNPGPAAHEMAAVPLSPQLSLVAIP